MVGRHPGEPDDQQRLLAHAEAGRQAQDRDDAVHLVRQVRGPAGVGLQRGPPLRSSVDQVPAEHGRRQPPGEEGEGGHHTEVPAPAADPPEQVRVVLGVHVQVLPGPGDHLGADEVVEGEAVAAGQPAHAAAHRQAGDAGGAHHADGHGQPVRDGGAVDVGEGGAGLHGHVPGRGIHVHPAQCAQVQDQPALHGAVPGHVVPSAAHGQRQARVLGRGQHRVDVRHGAHPGDGARPHVDHPVPDPPCLVVERVVGFDQCPGQSAPQRLERPRDLVVMFPTVHDPHRTGFLCAEALAPGRTSAIGGAHATADDAGPGRPGRARGPGREGGSGAGRGPAHDGADPSLGTGFPEPQRTVRNRPVTVAPPGSGPPAAVSARLRPARGGARPGVPELRRAAGRAG